MAERLDDFTFRGAGGALYPWDEWFDGSIWRLVKGVDYLVATPTMRSNIYNEAVRRGLKARTGETEGGLVVQAYTSGGAP